jgi:hypothetical protein
MKLPDGVPCRQYFVAKFLVKLPRIRPALRRCLGSLWNEHRRPPLTAPSPPAAFNSNTRFDPERQQSSPPRSSSYRKPAGLIPNPTQRVFVTRLTPRDCIKLHYFAVPNLPLPYVRHTHRISKEDTFPWEKSKKKAFATL